MSSQRIQPLKLVASLVLLGCTWSACGSGLYELPPPPSREDWRRHSLNPGEEENLSREIFLAAKRSILSFTEAMSFEQFDRAYTLLSNETRILLDDLSPTGRGESVLSDGIIERGGAQYTIDPVDLFVIRNLEEILDTQPDRMEAETTRRKEVYAISQEGDVHHLVVILEEDRWLIHKPEIELTPGAPGRRTTGE